MKRPTYYAVMAFYIGVHIGFYSRAHSFPALRLKKWDARLRGHDGYFFGEQKHLHNPSHPRRRVSHALLAPLRK